MSTERTMKLTPKKLATFLFAIIAPGARPKKMAGGYGIEVHASPFRKPGGECRRSPTAGTPIAVVYGPRIGGTFRLNFLGHEIGFVPTREDVTWVACWVRYVIEGGDASHPEAKMAWPFDVQPGPGA